MSEIRQVTITTSSPRGDDPGAVELGFYKVENDMVVLCDETGRSAGKRLAIGSGESPALVAARLLRDRWLKRARDGIGIGRSPMAQAALPSGGARCGYFCFDFSPRRNPMCSLLTILTLTRLLRLRDPSPAK
jgi:hypothetical protein